MARKLETKTNGGVGRTSFTAAAAAATAAAAAAAAAFAAGILVLGSPVPDTGHQGNTGFWRAGMQCKKKESTSCQNRTADNLGISLSE